MDEELQIANKIMTKEFRKRRYKILNSIDKIKNKCIMIEINNDHSPSIVLYYIDKNDDNVEEILGTCHFRNQFSVSLDNNITRIDLSLYCIVEDESNSSTFGYMSS